MMVMVLLFALRGVVIDCDLGYRGCGNDWLTGSFEDGLFPVLLTEGDSAAAAKLETESLANATEVEDARDEGVDMKLGNPVSTALDELGRAKKRLPCGCSEAQAWWWLMLMTKIAYSGPVRPGAGYCEKFQ